MNHALTPPDGSALADALASARLGWHLPPVKPGGKRPLTPNDHRIATTDEATITGRFTHWPDANAGISLAASGLAAINIDPRNDGSLSARPEQLPTLAALTGGGGYHLIVRVPPGGKLPGSLGDGIDVKHNGYILVAPPTPCRTEDRVRALVSRLVAEPAKGGVR